MSQESAIKREHREDGSLQLAGLKAWFDEERPWNAGFLSLLRAIAARESRDSPAIGTASLPQEECFRIGQRPTMAFSPREVASLRRQHGQLKIGLFGLGIWGAQGAMPLHMTEFAYNRTESFQDTTLVDFVDIFHHRALALFYRAWASAQSTVSLDSGHDQAFSFYIGSLVGIEPKELSYSCLPTHARLSSSVHLVREARNPDGLVGTLSHYFGVNVALDEFVDHWIVLSPDEHARLGVASASAIMGEGAILGEKIADRQHKFRLVIGPLSLAQYLRLTPQGADLPVLVEWVRSFIGFEYEWEIKLLVKPDEVPALIIGDEQHLGHTTWLGEPQEAIAVTGMVFEPEQYRVNTRKNHAN
ncbi:type VI secretion system baseplate subunit TssG [Neisseriaceae bacterium TC5R-5]|nr:type VI secretion system baseplate subunit TssG [Neisseriaceae bacterium TC5R-5]